MRHVRFGRFVAHTGTPGSSCDKGMMSYSERCVTLEEWEVEPVHAWVRYPRNVRYRSVRLAGG